MIAKIILKSVTDPKIGMAVIIPLMHEDDGEWICVVHQSGDEYVRTKTDMMQMWAVVGDKEYVLDSIGDVNWVLANNWVNRDMEGNVYIDHKAGYDYFVLNMSQPLVGYPLKDFVPEPQGDLTKQLYDSLNEFIENLSIPLYDFERAKMVEKGKTALDNYEKQLK